MRYFNFESLIKKYACTFTVVIASKGVYDEMGEWSTMSASAEKQGAIVSINDNKIYCSDGVLTTKDKELFMTESLGNIENTHVIYNGEKYKVESNPQNNHQFTGVWQYTLKWISAFEGGDADV